MRAAEHAPRGLNRLLECRHGLADIVERGAFGRVESFRVIAPHHERDIIRLQRFEEAKSLLLKAMPVARRVLGEGHRITLKMRWLYGAALYMDPGATLDDLRKAVSKLEEVERTARRVLGGAHPTTTGVVRSLQEARAALRARDLADISRIFGTDSSEDSS